jgi:hypothetical protein
MESVGREAFTTLFYMFHWRLSFSNYLTLRFEHTEYRDQAQKSFFRLYVSNCLNMCILNKKKAKEWLGRRREQAHGLVLPELESHRGPERIFFK